MNTPREIRACEALGKTGTIRLPSEKKDEPEIVRLLGLHGISVVRRIDHILVEVVLPDGYRLELHPRDCRHGNLLDGSGKEIGFMFFKDSGYDRHGSTTIYDPAE